MDTRQAVLVWLSWRGLLWRPQIGAAAFMGGATRMTLTTTVMVMETTGAMQLIVPLMITVFVAKASPAGAPAAPHKHEPCCELHDACQEATTRPVCDWSFLAWEFRVSHALQSIAGSRVPRLTPCARTHIWQQRVLVQDSLLHSEHHGCSSAKSS